MNTETAATITELAKDLNVSEHDIICLAQSVAHSIEQDGAREAALACSPEEQHEIVRAYLPVAVRKFNQFHATYLTNQEAREEFKKTVYDLLVEKINSEAGQ